MQKKLCLKDIIKKDSVLSLIDSNKKEILTFLGADDFNTLIISAKSLIKGSYKLYKDGKSSGTLSSHLYKDGKYTDGTMATEDIEITSKIIAKKQ